MLIFTYYTMVMFHCFLYIYQRVTIKDMGQNAWSPTATVKAVRWAIRRVALARLGLWWLWLQYATYIIWIWKLKATYNWGHLVVVACHWTQVTMVLEVFDLPENKMIRHLIIRTACQSSNHDWFTLAGCHASSQVDWQQGACDQMARDSAWNGFRS